MNNRLQLQEKLEAILDSRHVYYQPPESVKLEYPAIVYFKENINNTHAGDQVYKQNDIYKITVISKTPDIQAVREVSRLQTCRHDRHFVSDNLYHDVFSIYI